MKKLILAILLISMLYLSLGSIFFTPVSANGGVCGFLPCDLAAGCPDGNCPDTISETENLIRTAATLVFVTIFIWGVILVIKAAVTIIRSEGDEGKVQEGSRKIRGAMIGIAMVIIGVIGLIIVIVFFEATSIFNLEPRDPDLVDVPLAE